MTLSFLLFNYQTTVKDELGIFLIFASPVIFFIGLILVLFKKTRKAGLFILLGALVSLITGFSICSLR